MELLDVRNLRVTFQSGKEEMEAVQDISFTVKKGETVALIGESGSGKSVTSLAIMGLLPENGRVKDGSILFKGGDLLQRSKKEMQQIRGKEISMIFQDAMVSLNPSMKIGKQITEGLKYHKITERRNLKQEALRLLSVVGFTNPSTVYHQYPGQLSGGMKQRALIAMAISCEPELLIADEPTTALDVTIQKQILELMNEYKIKTETSMLLITHDFGVVSEYADRVLVMFGGKIVEAADVFTIFNRPIHSYTRGLMNSIPRIESPQDYLTTIRDSAVENPFYKGRAFAPETYSLELKTYYSESELVEVEPGHYVRFFTEKEGVTQTWQNL